MEENRGINLLNQKLPPVSERKKQEILQMIHNKKTDDKRTKKFFFLPTIAVCVSLLILTIFIVSFLTDDRTTNKNAAMEKTTTNQHLPELNEVKESQYLINDRSDDMDEWKFVLSNKELIVDPTLKNNIERGDIVYFRTTKAMKAEQNVESTKIARIVALPGETISVKDSQVFINGKKLDTFYGHERDRGEKAVKSTEVLKPLKLLSNEYFVISDTWWRGILLKNGKISKDDILGKVVGIKKE